MTSFFDTSALERSKHLNYREEREQLSGKQLDKGMDKLYSLFVKLETFNWKKNYIVLNTRLGYLPFYDSNSFYSYLDRCGEVEACTTKGRYYSISSYDDEIVLEQSEDEYENSFSEYRDEYYHSDFYDDAREEDTPSEEMVEATQETADESFVLINNTDSLNTSVENTGYYTDGVKTYESRDDVPQGVCAQYCPILAGGVRRKNKRMKRRGKSKRKGNQMVHAGQLGLRVPPQMKANYPYVKEFWRYNTILTTDGTGSISAYVSLRNPTTAVDGSGTYLRADDLAKVYDEYKVLRTSVVLDFLLLNPVVGDICISTDFDSVPVGPYTFNNLVDTQYARIFNGTNQISYSTKVPRLSEGTYRERAAIIHQGGFYDFNTPPDEGFIAIALERFQPNTRLIRVTSMMEVILRRRRTLNATESVTIEEDPPTTKKKKS